MGALSVPPVLHVAAPAEFGGAERVLFALAHGLHRRGRAVHVLAFLDEGCAAHPLVGELRAAGVPTSGIELPHRAYAGERAHLRRVLRETGARVVHTHGARVDVVDAPVARSLGLATVSTLHGFTGGRVRNRLYEWLQVRRVARGDAVVAVSRAMVERLRAGGVPPARLHVIPNAWAPVAAPLPRREARAVLGVPSEGARIGWVGRLTREKGAHVLLAAVRELGDAPVSVSVVGAGGEGPALMRWAHEHGLASRITWHGAVPGAGRYMAAFDVFVLSSRTEGTPIVLFEAMAAEVPIVATAVGGVPDVVTPEEAVLIPRDDPEALARAIRDVLEDPPAARARARAAVTRLATRFEPNAWLDTYERLYARVTSGRPVEAATAC